MEHDDRNIRKGQCGGRADKLVTGLSSHISHERRWLNFEKFPSRGQIHERFAGGV